MNNPMQMISQIRQNPIQFLASKGLNIPKNIANDPNAIIQHLMNSGKVSQEQYNQAIKMAEQMGMKK